MPQSLGTYSSLVVRYEPPGDWTTTVGANGEHIATFNGEDPPGGTVTITLDDSHAGTPEDPHGEEQHTGLPNGSRATSSNGMTTVTSP